MTVQRGQATLPLDPQASLRTELVGQLAAAQLALEAAIAELSRSGADSTLVAASRTQLASLIGLRQQIGTTTGAALADLRAEVTAAVTAAAIATQQAQSADSAAAAAIASTLANAAVESRSVVQSAMRDMHRFDSYLRFASAEDEETYRRREAETRRAIEAELAKHTLQGDLTANALALRQLNDAGAHGADASPEFAATRERLTNSYSTLRQSMIASGQTTETQDRIASGNKVPAEPQPAPSTASGKRSDPVSPTPSRDSDLGDVLATLRAAGIQTNEHGAIGHGLNEQAPQSSVKGRRT